MRTPSWFAHSPPLSRMGAGCEAAQKVGTRLPIRREQGRLDEASTTRHDQSVRPNQAAQNQAAQEMKDTMTTTPSVLTRYHTDQINRLASALGMLGETSEDVVTEAMKRIAASGEAVAWRVANHPAGPYALRKTKPSGWAVIQPLYAAPQPAISEAVEVLCRGCGKPTMHLGTVCYTCSHAAPQPASVADGDAWATTGDPPTGVDVIGVWAPRGDFPHEVELCGIPAAGNPERQWFNAYGPCSRPDKWIHVPIFAARGAGG